MILVNHNARNENKSAIILIPTPFFLISFLKCFLQTVQTLLHITTKKSRIFSFLKNGANSSVVSLKATGRPSRCTSSFREKISAVSPRFSPAAFGFKTVKGLFSKNRNTSECQLKKKKSIKIIKKISQQKD